MTMSARAGMTKAGIVNIAEAHVGELQTQLQQWGEEIEVLVAQVAADGLLVKPDYHTDIAELNSKHRTAQARFVEFKTAGSATWREFKSGVDRAWDDVEGAFAKLGNRS